MEYGYARVSTREQNLDRQIAALMDAGVAERKIFSDKQSGKDFARPQYQRMKHRMKQGDVLFVKELDRLGRNYDDIIAEWRELTKVKGIDIERQKNKRRQAEGIAIARAKGIKFGRPLRDMPDNFSEMAMLYLTKELTSREAAAGCGLCQSTFLRRVKKNKNNLKTENKNVEFFTQVI